MVETQLGSRQGTILRAVVREHVRTGEPVGSAQLVDRYRLGVSSATVRNDMAHLEQLHFLMQPHTSAGRIPTDRGYRFYVDSIENPVRLEPARQRALVTDLSRDFESLDALLRHACEVLSRITHYAAAALAPRLTPSRLRRIELIRMGARAVTVILVADNGRIEQRALGLTEDVSAADLDRMNRDLNSDLENVPLGDAHARISARAERATERDRRILGALADQLRHSLVSEDRVFLTGASNLADERSFGREALHGLYEALESQSALLGLLADATGRPVTVRIGSELTVEGMRPVSLVAANYGIDGRPLGTVGLIGPTRMDYRRAMAAAGAVARTLESALAALYSQPG